MRSNLLLKLDNILKLLLDEKLGIHLWNTLGIGALFCIESFEFELDAVVESFEVELKRVTGNANIVDPNRSERSTAFIIDFVGMV